MHVSAVLKRKGRDVVTVHPTHSIAAVAEVLARHRIGTVLVVDDLGHPAGVVSERDIVRLIATEGPAALDRRTGDVMTHPVVTCAPSDTMSAVMAVMTERHIRHLPVMEGGALVGMVSIGDAVKARLDDAELEVDSMRTFVAGVR